MATICRKKRDICSVCCSLVFLKKSFFFLFVSCKTFKCLSVQSYSSQLHNYTDGKAIYRKAPSFTLPEHVNSAFVAKNLKR